MDAGNNFAPAAMAIGGLALNAGFDQILNDLKILNRIEKHKKNTKELFEQMKQFPEVSTDYPKFINDIIDEKNRYYEEFKAKHPVLGKINDWSWKHAPDIYAGFQVASLAVLGYGYVRDQFRLGGDFNFDNPEVNMDNPQMDDLIHEAMERQRAEAHAAWADKAAHIEHIPRNRPRFGSIDSMSTVDSLNLKFNPQNVGQIHNVPRAPPPPPPPNVVIPERVPLAAHIGYDPLVVQRIGHFNGAGAPIIQNVPP